MQNVLKFTLFTFLAVSLPAQAASTKKVVDFSFGKKEGAILVETSGNQLSKLVLHEPIKSEVKLEKLESNRKNPVGSTAFKWLFIELMTLESHNFDRQNGGDIRFTVPGKHTETGDSISIETDLKKTQDGTWFFEYEGNLAYALAIERDENEKKIASFNISTLVCERDSIEAYVKKTQSVDLLSNIDCHRDTTLAALTYLRHVAPNLNSDEEAKGLSGDKISAHRKKILSLAKSSSDYEIQNLINEATDKGYLVVADTLIKD
jgi:hypothetical protein